MGTYFSGFQEGKTPETTDDVIAVLRSAASTTEGAPSYDEQQLRAILDPLNAEQRRSIMFMLVTDIGGKLVADFSNKLKLVLNDDW